MGKSKLRRDGLQAGSIPAGKLCAGVAWLAKTVISGNGTGVYSSGGTVNSYGDNYINDNAVTVLGSLTPVSTQ
jgi:hypothetical protein